MLHRDSGISLLDRLVSQIVVVHELSQRLVARASERSKLLVVPLVFLNRFDEGHLNPVVVSVDATRAVEAQECPVVHRHVLRWPQTFRLNPLSPYRNRSNLGSLPKIEA